MNNVNVFLEKSFRIGQTDERLFSSFLEHLGRAVYGGVYEPGHPSADSDGFRGDVLTLVKELNVSHVRYPGGNFVSGYNWQDGIGPREQRPRRLDYAWKTIESNAFGINEFAKWCRVAGTNPMAAINMGTGTPQEAGYFVEYCNFPGGTYWSDLRAQHGYKNPHDIKLWCVGNEMDGPWQTCHLDAADYGKKARETAKIMKWADESIELVVCGSSHTGMPTYPEYDRIVLEHTYEHADYISLHAYYGNTDGNALDFLTSFASMNAFIKSVSATADYVKALKRSKKTMHLSFDEWNVWYHHRGKSKDWAVAPEILEDNYTLLDALCFGGLVVTLLNNADRVKIACLAQLVNVIAPIFTQTGGGVLRQTIFYPFKDMSVYGRGTVLSPVVKSPQVETKHGDVPVLHTSAVLNDDETELTVFALNVSDGVRTEFDLRTFGAVELLSHTCLDGDDLDAVNSFANPDAVKPRLITQPGDATAQSSTGVVSIDIPKTSWNVIRFSIKN